MFHRRRASLGVLIGAAVLLDLLWAVFVLVGLEHVRVDPGKTAVTPLAFVSDPMSHSLLTCVVWALIAAGGFWAVTRYTRVAAVIARPLVSRFWGRNMGGAARRAEAARGCGLLCRLTRTPCAPSASASRPKMHT